jgi:hypothetical protein
VTGEGIAWGECGAGWRDEAGGLAGRNVCVCLYWFLGDGSEVLSVKDKLMNVCIVKFYFVFVRSAT